MLHERGIQYKLGDINYKQAVVVISEEKNFGS